MDKIWYGAVAVNRDRTSCIVCIFWGSFFPGLDGLGVGVALVVVVVVVFNSMPMGKMICGNSVNLGCAKCANNVCCCGGGGGGCRGCG